MTTLERHVSFYSGVRGEASGRCHCPHRGMHICMCTRTRIESRVLTEIASWTHKMRSGMFFRILTSVDTRL